MIPLMWRKSIVLSRKYSVFTQSLQVEDIEKKKSCNYPDNSTIWGGRNVISVENKSARNLQPTLCLLIRKDPICYPRKISGTGSFCSPHRSNHRPEVNAHKSSSSEDGFLTWAPFVSPPTASFTTHMDRHIWGLEPVNRFLLSLVSPCWMPTWLHFKILEHFRGDVNKPKRKMMTKMLNRFVDYWPKAQERIVPALEGDKNHFWAGDWKMTTFMRRRLLIIALF